MGVYVCLCVRVNSAVLWREAGSTLPLARDNWDRLQPIPNPELDKCEKMDGWLFTCYESILIKYVYNKKI